MERYTIHPDEKQGILTRTVIDNDTNLTIILTLDKSINLLNELDKELKQLKQQIYELPKSCLECKNENCEHQYIECYYEARHHNCPLQSLASYTKQVKMEVIADVEKRIINYCRRQSKKQFQKSIEQIKVDLLTSINQIQGETK